MLTGLDIAYMRARRSVAAAMQRYGLWRGIAWGVAAVSMYDGSGYIWKGSSTVRSPDLFVLRNVPFGVHLHGLILLVLSAMIIYSSAKKNKGARQIMFATFIYSIWVSLAITIGWVINSEVTWSAPSKWMFIAWVALWLSATAEAEARPNRHTPS